MGIFTGKIKVNEVANNLLNKIDDSSLTMQEKAVGTIEALERLGITPSSKTRRQVTWIQLCFIILCYLAAVALYKLDPELAKFIKSVPLDYGSNGIIQTINAFFYGGYYLTKNVSPMMKERIEAKKQKREIELKKEEQKLYEHSEKFERRNKKRNRRDEI